MMIGGSTSHPGWVTNGYSIANSSYFRVVAFVGNLLLL